MVTGEFDVEILRDLIAEGYEGQELLKRFKIIYERNQPNNYVARADELVGEFDVEILRDLITEGYEGQELLEKFKTTREKVPAAFKKMMDDLIKRSGGKTYTLEECFNNRK